MVVQDEERAAKSQAAGSQTTGSIQRPVRWFVDITSWEPIAMDLRQLVRAFDAGRVDADTLVWRKGMPDWRRLRDVSELAERLLDNSAANNSAANNPAAGHSAANPIANTGAGETTGRIASDPPPPEAGNSNSEPPPRQSERSRTPPASYTVGSGSSGTGGAEADAPPGGTASYGTASYGTASRAEGSYGAVADAANPEGRPSVPPAEVGSRPLRSSFPPAEASTRASRTSVAPAEASLTEAVKSIPGPSSSSAPRPNSRRRGRTPSRPNASPVAPSRTVTRTGLESPAQVVARNSFLPPAGESDGNDADATRPSLAARARDSRTSAPPGGARRPQSSDETPAQKPSSLSVPPGAMAADQPRPRNRRLLALAAVVLGSAIVVRAFTSGGDAPVSAQQRTETVVEPKQVGKALEPVNTPTGLRPRDGAAAARPAGASEPPAATPAVPSTAQSPAVQAANSPTIAVVPAHPAAPAPASSATLVHPAPAPAPQAHPAAPPSVPARSGALGETPTRSADSVATVGMLPPAPAVSSPAAHPNEATAVPRPAVSGAPVSGTGATVTAPKATPAAAAAAPLAAPPAATAAAGRAPTTPAAAAPATPSAAAPGAPPAATPAAPSAATPPPASPAAGGKPPAGAPASPANAPPVPAPAAPAGSSPAAATAPSAATGGAPDPVPPAPAASSPVAPARPFDVKAATQQLEAAAVKAAACAGAGSTRGNGKVTVAIEPWGRVGRVTHLNQDFVGTPVGLCVMQAFQQIQVPPFDGVTQSIPGAFHVE